MTQQIGFRADVEASEAVEQRFPRKTLVGL